MIKKSALLLVGAVALLIALGLVMLSSVGAFTPDNNGDVFHDLKKQSMFLAVGVAVMLAGLSVDYRRLQKCVWVIYGLAVALLVCCFMPVIGKPLNGAARWVGFGGIQGQPSEFAKLAGIITLAAWCAKYRELRATFAHGFLLPLAVVGLLAGLIVVEVDLGNTILLLLASLSVLFVAGARFSQLFLLMIILLGALAATVYLMPERCGRVLAIFNLEAYRQGDGLQQWLSLVALGSGGDFGLGLGQSRQKMWALPYANSDFIFPIIGEELGLVCTLAVVACFVLIAMAGISISTHAPDRFGKLLGFGIVALILLQALVNIGVCTACLPNKGMPLPFISAGGSNLVVLLGGVGILLNIYRQGRHAADDTEPVLRRRKLTPAL